MSAVTFAFGDAGADLYGLVRLGVGPAADRGELEASALVIVFAGGRPVVELAREGEPVPAGAEIGRLAVGGVEASVDGPGEADAARLGASGAGAGADRPEASADAPAERYALRFAEAGLDLRFEPSGPPVELATDESGPRRFERLCRVNGTVGDRRIDCLGQRSDTGDDPDWSRTEAARTIAVWLGDDLAIALAAVRPRGAHHHAEESVAAAILQPDGAVEVDDPRLSTTYDGDGRPHRAGLELWVRPDDPVPQRAAGEALYATALTLGGLRHECAFFRWHMDGRAGVGRYGIVRPV